MRRLLGALVLVPVLLTALTACGSDDDATADDPAPTGSTSTSTSTPVETATDDPTTVDPSDTPTEAPTDAPTKSPPLTPGDPGQPGDLSYELVEIVSATAGGGREAGTDAVPIASEADAKAYAAAFSDDLAADLTASLDRARRGDGGTVYAAVVGMGCDVPLGVDVTQTAAGLTITGQKVPDPTPECFAPVTSVAIVAITG